MPSLEVGKVTDVKCQRYIKIHIKHINDRDIFFKKRHQNNCHLLLTTNKREGAGVYSTG